MKQRSLIIALLLTVTLATGGLAQPADTLSAQLEGRWQAMLPAGVLQEEVWIMAEDAPGAVLLRGQGYRISARGDTTGSEALRLETMDDKVVYVADLAHNETETVFPLTRWMDDSTWVFENPAHDFPQRLIYAFKPASDSMIVRVDRGQPDLGDGFILRFGRMR